MIRRGDGTIIDGAMLLTAPPERNELLDQLEAAIAAHPDRKRPMAKAALPPRPAGRRDDEGMRALAVRSMDADSRPPGGEQVVPRSARLPARMTGYDYFAGGLTSEQLVAM